VAPHRGHRASPPNRLGQLYPLAPEGRYREAEPVVLIMDHLNTHSPASLYEAFPPEEAKRLADRIEIHHTSKGHVRQ
jgi:hypothetical protein